MKIGMLTIGQSPRDDIIPEIREVLGSEVDIVEKGVLDGLRLKEIDDFYSRKSDPILITRMNDGTEVKITKNHVIARIKDCILELEAKGVEISILLCTEDFSEIKSKKILLQPGRLLKSMVKAILNKGKLGVIIPSFDQIQDIKKKWRSTDFAVVAGAVSPYTGTEKEIIEIANRFRNLKVDMVILDCIGFNKMTKAVFREITQKPVLLPRTIIGRIAREIIETR
ncbi:MAG: AroM family protein [Nitrospirales bacterium]